MTEAFNWRKLSDNDNLWVVNTVGADGLRQRGKIAITIQPGTPEARTVLIENTWVAQDLSNQALPSHIIRSMDFRGLVQRGILQVLSPEQAAQQLADVRAQAELSRLNDVAAGRVALVNHAPLGGSYSPGGWQTGQTEAIEAAAAASAHRQYAGDRASLVEARQRELAGQPVDQRGLARVLHSSDINPPVIDNAPGNTIRPYQGPAAAEPTVERARSNLGLEVIDRLNRGEITEAAAVAAMAGVATLMSPEEKLRLKQMNNLSPALLNAVALLA